jgi:hypothetical protein
VIRAVKQFFAGRGDTDRGEQCQALLVRLAEDRFNLAVVGKFKRSMSSLMNAIIGQENLSTRLLPLTSAITTLCWKVRRFTRSHRDYACPICGPRWRRDSLQRFPNSCCTHRSSG